MRRRRGLIRLQIRLGMWLVNKLEIERWVTMDEVKMGRESEVYYKMEIWARIMNCIHKRICAVLCCPLPFLTR